MTETYVYEFIGTDDGMHVTRECEVPLTMKQLQSGVGGYVELLRTAQGLTMVVDEEGGLKGKPVNKTATALLHPRYGGQVVRGNVYVLHYELN